jgi:hypothetical protein
MNGVIDHNPDIYDGLPEDSEAFFKSNDSLLRRIFTVFETSVGYLSRMISITKYGLKTYVFSTGKKGNLFLPLASKMSVFAALNVFLTPWLLLKDGEEGVSSYRKKDFEGVALAATSAIGNSGNGVDQVMTCMSGVNALDSSVKTVGVFAKIMLPLGIALTALGILTESHKMYHTIKIMNALESVKDYESMREFLIEHVGVKGFDDQPRKTGSFERRSGLKGFENLTRWDGKLFADVKTFQKRRFACGFINWTTLVVTLVALSLFFTPMGPLVPMALLLGCGIVKLSLMLYKEFELKKGLKLTPSLS